MRSILIDTNILVYTFDPRNFERQEKAIAILVRLEPIEAGILSVQCLAEFVNVVISKMRLSISEVILQVENWQHAFKILELTPQIVLEAARGVRDHRLSYYDAQIWATARLHQIPVVFSEDFQDGQTLEGVRFVNPFTVDFNIENWI
jgi:predicted nucleic acid-binding protein